MTGQGASATYTLMGFAAFVVTGYHLPGVDGRTSMPRTGWTPRTTARAATYCLNGYFTQGVIPSTGTFGGTNLGASVIDLTG